MAKYIFSSLINCGICNDKKYKGIKERNKNKYICSNYQLKNCIRNILIEDNILKFLKIYCDKNNIKFESTQLLAQQHIEKIIALPNSCFEIYYRNGDIQYCKDNGIKFV